MPEFVSTFEKIKEILKNAVLPLTISISNNVLPRLNIGGVVLQPLRACINSILLTMP